MRTMPGLIPRHFIDDLLARADIVEIIDARVPLKKAGKNYQACCPFHTEKTPSFSSSEIRCELVATITFSASVLLTLPESMA